MKIYKIINSSTRAEIIILHFGLGLVGYGFRKQLYFNYELDIEEYNVKFDWNSNFNVLADQINDIIAVVRKISTIKENPLVNVLWSAGKAGFSATKFEANEESEFFNKTINLLVKSLVELKYKIHFCLLSSAGGLHESNDLIVTSSDQIGITRNYGYLKKEQEDLLINHSLIKYKTIFRLSSVYTTSNFSGRLGLISVLVKSGIIGKVVNINGNENTLRDYVLDLDIGRFIQYYFSQINFSPLSIKYLINGKPSSILEIKNSVEKVINKKIYINYSSNNVNASNITFSSVLKPKNLKSSLITLNIKLLYDNILEYF